MQLFFLIKLISGEKRHRTTGEWNRSVGEPRLAPVHVDPEAFAVNLQFTEQHRKEIASFVDALGLPILSVSYEDLVLNRQAVIEDTFRFLGVHYRAVTSPLVKNTSDDLRKAVINFDELRDRYIGTRYEAMFDEVLLPGS